MIVLTSFVIMAQKKKEFLYPTSQRRLYTCELAGYIWVKLLHAKILLRNFFICLFLLSQEVEEVAYA
jgi:hypothetical protein